MPAGRTRRGRSSWLHRRFAFWYLIERFFRDLWVPQRIVYAANPTIFMLDGFEHGLVGTGTAGPYGAAPGGASIVTSPVRSGSRALQIAAANAAANVAYSTTTNASNPGDLRHMAMSFYIRFSTLPSATCTVAHFTNANGTGQVQFNQATTKFRVAINAQSPVDFGGTISTGTWYRIDCYMDSSSGTASMKARLDGGTEQTSTRSQTAADITAFRLGTAATTETFTAFYDDWMMSQNGATDYALLGTHHIESLIPSADGTHNINASGDYDSFTTTAFSNSTTNGNTFIGHRPMQFANTAEQVIRNDAGASSPTTRYMEFTLEDLSVGSAATVLAVRTYASFVEASTTGSSSGQAKLLLSDATEVTTTGWGGTTAAGTWFTAASVICGVAAGSNVVEDPGTTVRGKFRLADAPSGGWDVTKVNGLKARVGYGDTTPAVNFIDFMIEVLVYDDATATPSAVAGVADVPADTATGAATATPSAVAAVAAVPAPSVIGDGIASPSAVAGIAAVPADTASAQAVASPGAVAGIADVPAPTIDTGNQPATATPATVTAIAAVPADTVSADAIATPSAVAGIASVPVPSALAAATSTPSAVTGIAAVPASSVSGLAVATPSAVVGTGAVPADAASGAAVATSSTVVAVASIGAPTALAGATPTPSAVAGVAAIPADAVLADSLVSPGSVAALGSVPAPSPSAAATATPATVEAVASIPTPDVDTGTNPLPATVVTIAAVPAPTITTDARAPPDSVAALAAVPDPAPAGDANVSVASVDAIADVPAPTVHEGEQPATAAPDTVGAVAAIPRARAVASSDWHGPDVEPDSWPVSSGAGWPASTSSGWEEP